MVLLPVNVASIGPWNDELEGCWFTGGVVGVVVVGGVVADRARRRRRRGPRRRIVAAASRLRRHEATGRHRAANNTERGRRHSADATAGARARAATGTTAGTTTARAAAGRAARAGDFRGSQHVRLHDRGNGRLTLEGRGRRNLERASGGRREPGRGSLACGIGHDGQRRRAAKRRALTADAERNRDAGDGKVIAIAHLDDGCDCGLLLNDIDCVFAFENNDLQTGRRTRLLSRRGRRHTVPRPQLRPSTRASWIPAFRSGEV